MTLLEKILVYGSIPFVFLTIYFGARSGGYYDTDKYEGHGTAHKVLK